MKNILNILLNCIIKESKQFLINDMKIDIIEIKKIPEHILENHISSINLTSSRKFKAIISSQDKLLDAIFDGFFPYGVDESEKKEIMDDLINELINTIVGLSIRNFPSEYKDLQLGLPVKLSKKETLTLLKNSNIQNVQIITAYGNLSCTLLLV